MQTTHPVDDATAIYAHNVHPHFEDLKQVASQLAALLVMSAAGGKSAGPDHPLLQSAEQLYRESSDGIRRAHITARTGRHHRHLLNAAGWLRDALTAAHHAAEVDPILTTLRLAYTELQQAADSLPGFEMISFDHACCARLTHV
jgi:hypothetical protein